MKEEKQIVRETMKEETKVRFKDLSWPLKIIVRFCWLVIFCLLYIAIIGTAFMIGFTIGMMGVL